MGLSRIRIAKPDIIAHFESLQKKVFKKTEIAAILYEKRRFWRLAESMGVEKFIDFLRKDTKLRTAEFPFPYRKETRYFWGDVSVFEIALTLRDEAFLSHYTAVYFHGLTEQVPKTVYVNFEQPPPADRSTELEQGRIDAAFKRAPRIAKRLSTKYEDRQISILNSMGLEQLGVIDATGFSGEKLRLTDVERTLIDIAVRPFYAGGIAEVLKAYRLAKDKVSVNKMSATLEKLGYIYPYHQAIGFYLERAEYKPSAVNIFRRFDVKYDFYLTHQMKDTDYSKTWRLFFPKGF